MKGDETQLKNKPIGVFDSGLGGLTAVRELMQIMPSEDVIYFGDSSRVPYGSRSESTIIRYAKQDISFLESFDIKIIISACGTVSSVALPQIKDTKIPVVGVVEPAAQEAAKATKNGKIGIIGTEGTIASGAYEKAVLNIIPDAKIITKACPMFVPLVENGYIHHPAAEMIAKEYLDDIIKGGADTLILGCTHYPLLSDIIHKIAGDGVTLIDAGKASANHVKALLEKSHKLCDKKQASYSFYTSDLTKRFTEIAKLFLGRDIGEAKLVDIEKY